MTPAEQIATYQRELTEAYALRAQADERITALRNTLQGAALGVELQKQATPAPTP